MNRKLTYLENQFVKFLDESFSVYKLLITHFRWNVCVFIVSFNPSSVNSFSAAIQFFRLIQEISSSMSGCIPRGALRSSHLISSPEEALQDENVKRICLRKFSCKILSKINSEDFFSPFIQFSSSWPFPICNGKSCSWAMVCSSQSLAFSFSLLHLAESFCFTRKLLFHPKTFVSTLVSTSHHGN